MARKPPKPPEPEKREVDPSTGIRLLTTQIEKAEQLLASVAIHKDSQAAWDIATQNYLEKAFGRHSPNVSNVMDVGKYGAFPMNASEQYWQQRRKENLESKVARLRSLIELLETETQLLGSKPPTAHASEPSGHRIFVVHGHDEAALLSVARFLEQLEQDVLILREQPNQGRTIIEKFEDYANVGFAVVLLTPDDRGGTATDPDANLRGRARQNVILELGYFIGRLGRRRVCALYRSGVEIPSDYSGVLYVELDQNGGWRLQLAKELKAAGYTIDLNRAV